MSGELISVLLVFICISDTSFDYINTLHTERVSAAVAAVSFITMLLLLLLLMIWSSISFVVEFEITGCYHMKKKYPANHPKRHKNMTFTIPIDRFSNVSRQELLL